MMPKSNYPIVSSSLSKGLKLKGSGLRNRKKKEMGNAHNHGVDDKEKKAH